MLTITRRMWQNIVKLPPKNLICLSDQNSARAAAVPWALLTNSRGSFLNDKKISRYFELAHLDPHDSRRGSSTLRRRT